MYFYIYIHGRGRWSAGEGSVPKQMSNIDGARVSYPPTFNEHTLSAADPGGFCFLRRSFFLLAVLLVGFAGYKFVSLGFGHGFWGFVASFVVVGASPFHLSLLLVGFAD